MVINEINMPSLSQMQKKGRCSHGHRNTMLFSYQFTEKVICGCLLQKIGVTYVGNASLITENYNVYLARIITCQQYYNSLGCGLPSPMASVFCSHPSFVTFLVSLFAPYENVTSKILQIFLCHMSHTPLWIFVQ